MCTIGSAQQFLISLIGLYIGKIFIETKARPFYFVRERLNI